MEVQNGIDAPGTPPVDSAPEAGTDQPQADPQQSQAAAQTVATNEAAALKGRQPNWTAADTQNAQVAALVRKELGLPKNASEAKVREALDAYRQPTSQFDYESLDPAAQEALKERDAELWGMATEVYGEEFVEGATTLYEQSRSLTPTQFAKALYDWVLSATEAPGDSSDADEQPSGSVQAEQVPTVGDGDVPQVAPRPNNDPAGAYRDSGNMVGFIRSLGIGRGQPSS